MTDEAPQSDAERITWLWDRLDKLNGEKASMQVLLERAEAQVRERDEAIAKLSEMVEQLNADLMSTAQQVNEARASAATAVHDYIARTT